MKRFLQLLVWTCLLSAEIVAAQALPDVPVLSGKWEGTMQIGPNSFTLGFTFSQVQGNYVVGFFSQDMGIYGMPADSVVIENNRIKIHVRMVDGEYNGILRMNDEGSRYIRIDGDWFQQAELMPLTLMPVQPE